MGGEILIDSDPEKGLRFQFTIPVHSEKRGDSEFIKSLRALKPRILVINTHKEVINYVTRIITEIGGTVTGAPTLAAAAKQLLRGNVFSGCVVGFDMLHSDFAGLMGNIARFIPKENIIIFVKNETQALAHEKCLKYGFSEAKIITVPILPTALLEQSAAGFGLKVAVGARTAAAPDFSGKNILVVDDHEITLEIMGGILEATKAKIFTAKNGLQAVEMYTENPTRFDAVLMDVQMPIMDGLTATRTIRASETPVALTLPIIAMTANIFDLDKKSCYEAGMSRYVSKPISVRVLYRVLSEVLG
jgi:CheY-like chemotaxis protein